MNESFYTIGMAGHIDHGKTSLTKALTNVDTDRLKEEKERKITIELGYAPFYEKGVKASIIDVPGHEKFIRQMIAGVAGIDLVLLVIAADEGVMPQTREHLQILSFLGIKNGIIVVTKSDKVEEDFLPLVQEDIASAVVGTAFEASELIFVDSLSNKGIDSLKSKIIERLQLLPSRTAKGDFRFPIDQVFTLQGKGTVVRGTVYEGAISVGSQVTLLPSKKDLRIKNIHVHNKEVEKAYAGQRAAINVAIGKDEVVRGNVLTSSLAYPITQTVDIALTSIPNLEVPLKQRAPIKFHTATTEVMGTIVFFDRNELSQNNEELLCQVRLQEPVVIKRGDRFVLRRPTPVETIGGGWVIDPHGEKYRFGMETVNMLKQKKEGTPEERVLAALDEEKLASVDLLSKYTSIEHVTLQDILNDLVDSQKARCIDRTLYTSQFTIDEIIEKAEVILSEFHQEYPMRLGMNKAEIISTLPYPKRIVEMVIDEQISNVFKKHNQYIALEHHVPEVPKQWKTRVQHVIADVKKDNLQVAKWADYLLAQQIPSELHMEIKRLYIEKNELVELDDDILLHKNSFETAKTMLYENTVGRPFTVQDAKAALNLSRKSLIPLLESFDKQGITKRVENERHWVQKLEKVENEQATN